MEIIGKLKDDLKANRVVLFLGAGVGQAAGLIGTEDLSEFLFKKAGHPEKYEKYKKELSRIVAGLDNDPHYRRQFVHKHLLDYFGDKSKYTNLQYHAKMLQLPCWKAIYTTNYDISLELLEHEYCDRRLIPIVDAKDRSQLRNHDPNKLKYFKIHGCARLLDWSPETSPPLVLTRKDFRNSLERKRPLIEELKNYLYDFNCSVVFIGFRVTREENDNILYDIQSVYDSVASLIHQAFNPFAVLRNVDEDTRFDLETGDITLLSGSFEEFILEAEKIVKSGSDQTKDSMHVSATEKKYITINGNTTGIPIEICEQNSSQFHFFDDKYFTDKTFNESDLQYDELTDLWKTQPNDMFLFSNRYIERTQYNDIFRDLSELIGEVQSTGSTHILHLRGDRASGKSVIAKQLAKHAFEKFNIPVLTLNPSAVYSTAHENGEIIETQGWDVRLIDKFLSRLFESNEKDIPPVTVIVADHLFHKQYAIDILLKYLENHNKPCVLILTSNLTSIQEGKNSKERIFNLYKIIEININAKLDDAEIEKLFDSIRKDRPGIAENRNLLLSTAKDDCNRDLLFILYTWFDKSYRRLEDIIAEESDKLSNQDSPLKDLYLTVALFHQFNFSPRISLCAEANEISVADFQRINNSAIFNAFLNFQLVPGESKSKERFAFTRHPKFARLIVDLLISDSEQQIKYFVKVLERAKLSDQQFVQDFLIMIFSSNEVSYNINQITLLKEASEKRFNDDWVLNHQFGAYLIRENAELENARYYLDQAFAKVDNEISKSSITHSLGNLKFAMYRTESDKEKALEHYKDAEDYFTICRSLRSIPEEHGYVTNIDIISYRLSEKGLTDTERALLIGERNSLAIEAFTVVPHKRQNYLLNRLQTGKISAFKDIPDNDRQILINIINDGKASALLLQYYLKDLLSAPKNKNWLRISSIADIYNKTEDLATSIVLSLVSKKAFLEKADIRFEKMRTLFNRIVKYRKDNLSFIFVSEYIRLLMIDAFVLNKYDYIRSQLSEILDIFRDFKPRFLDPEYIMEDQYYLFDSQNAELQKDLFSKKSEHFNDSAVAKRFTQNIQLNRKPDNKFFHIKMDSISGYFIKGIKKELSQIAGNATIEFSVKYTYEGFLACDIIS